MEISTTQSIAQKSLESLDAATFLFITGAVAFFCISYFIKFLTRP